MSRSPVFAAAAALIWWWLGAGLALADLIITSDIEQYTRLAADHKDFPIQTFRSSSIVAPVFHVNRWDRTLTDDEPYIFIGGNYNAVGGGSGPMIIDASDLSLVYRDPSFNNAYSSEVSLIHGKRHLAFYAVAPGLGHKYFVYDENYNRKYVVGAKGGYGVDMHELQVTNEGTAVFVAHRNVHNDCTHWGGPKDCRFLDTGFQEVDLETGKAIFTWSGTDHMDPHDTFAEYVPGHYGINDELKGNWDLIHRNSVRKTSDGNYLTSSRHYNNIQFINGTNGDVIWTLGGKKNDFKDLSDGRATNFALQHNARFYHNQSHITLFDNHVPEQGDCGSNCSSRGLHLEIDTDAMTARVVREYYHPGHVNALAMGGMQLLDSGNAIVGWGYNPSYVEFTSDGRVAMDIQRGLVGKPRKKDMFAYRVFKGNWTGRPTWPPNVTADVGPNGDATIYMSWNGATDISEWTILSSDNSTQLSEVGYEVDKVPRTGFETSASVQRSQLARFIAVAAVDKTGGVLGVSNPFDMNDANTEAPGAGNALLDDSQEDSEDKSEGEKEESKEGDKGNGEGDEGPENKGDDKADSEEDNKEVDKSDSKDDDKEAGKDDDRENSKTSYGGPGAAFAALVASAGALSAVIYIYRRRRAKRLGGAETKYMRVEDRNYEP